MLLASTIPLIWKTRSLSILNYPVSYICRLISFTSIVNEASFIANFFLLNIYFYIVITV